MKRSFRPWVVAAVMLSGAFVAAPPQASAKSQEPVQYEPAPEWNRYKDLAEQAIRASMIDPDSARLSWPWGYRQGFYKPMLAKRTNGYFSCGLVNGRNRMGGHTGNAYFVVVIDQDRVLYSEIANAGASLIGDACMKADLPPASSMEPPDVTRPGFYGILFRAGADGIEMLTVYPGSAAERAGVKTGMEVTSVNGVSVKASSNERVADLLRQVEGNADFQLADGAHLTVVRP